MLTFPPISPVAFSIFGLDIRWYALAYLTAFILGWLYVRGLNRLYALRALPLALIDDFLSWAMLGVIAGGRMGYILFYNLPFYLDHPLRVFYLWEGGMSFHGGASGVIIALIIFAYVQKIPLFQLSDMVCAAVPMGLFFGRLANFVNGELYGRVTSGPWGMVFPGTDGQPRYPTQLFEAAGEGALLFLILFMMMRISSVRARAGIVSAVFLGGYAIVRFMIEFIREPDVQVGVFPIGLTMGQILCLPMVLGALLVLVMARRRWGA